MARLKQIALAAPLALSGCAAYYTFVSGGYMKIDDTESPQTRRVSADFSTKTTRWEINFGRRDVHDALEVAKSQSKPEPPYNAFRDAYEQEFRRRAEQILKRQGMCDGSVTLFLPITENTSHHYLVYVECHHEVW